MKRTVRLTESELINLINSIVIEQEEPVEDNVGQFKYKIGKSGYDTESTVFPEIYLKENGDTYDVYAKGRKDNTIVFKQLTLPKESDLLLKFDSDTKQFLSDGPTADANLIASLISTRMKMGQGNWVIYTKKDGVPALGRLIVGPTTPVEYFVQKGMNRKKLIPNQVFSMNDYFVNRRNKKEAKSFVIEDIKDAEKV